uniref:NR LBD domain-containing protein n=1 Tax=Panagrolaimus davidi TaxID=227884 RepID=A0A914P4H4_9BILA
MNPEEMRFDSNSPGIFPPPKGFSTPHPPPPSLFLQHPSTSIPIQFPTPTTISTSPPTPFMKAFQQAIVLENILFVAVKNPMLFYSYLQQPHDPKFLEIALKNFQIISDKFGKINNFFMFQYIESSGISLETKMVQKFPAVNQLINQSLQQYADLIKIRVKNEFEFAALCQLSLLKIASEEFPQFQIILTQNYEIIAQNFRDYYSNENSNISLTNVSDLTNIIHLIRKTHRNQIISLLRTY